MEYSWFEFRVFILLDWLSNHSVMVKAIDCGIVVNEFELRSNYYVHFQTNTLGKGTNSFILPAIG